MFSRGLESIATLSGRLCARLLDGRSQTADGSLDRLRAILGRGSALLARLAGMATAHAVGELLALAGAFDIAPRKRTAWTLTLTRRLGAAATGALLIVLADIATDSTVRRVGAVVAQRLPRMLAQDWRSALSRGAPDTVEEAMARYELSIYDRPGRAHVEPNCDPPKALGKGVPFDALSLYRAGLSIDAIAKRLAFAPDDVRAGIAWALRAGVESTGEHVRQTNAPRGTVTD